MAAKGSYRNPTSRPCFVGCASCHRCEKRGRSECPLANSCSGRPDIEGMRDPHPDDLCRCKDGVMRWVTKENRVIVRQYGSSPFGTEVKTDTKNQDDSDWAAYLGEKREQMNNEFYDPIQFDDGGSTTDWTNRRMGSG